VEAEGGQAAPALGPVLRSAKGPARLPPSPLSRLLGSRDWRIVIECQASQVVVLSTGHRHATATLRKTPGAEHALVTEVRQLIERRQATVRPGEPPFRPVLAFRVWPDGLRSYYAANALLDELRLPTARENVETDAPVIPDPFHP
jgi:hypothetical protein